MSLAPYAPALTEADARHLFRRMGFGAPAARVAPLVGLTATEAVRRLLDEAEAAPAFSDPGWMAAPADVGLLYNVIEDVHRRMLEHPVREKLALFWQNHFGIGVKGVGNVRQLWRYYLLLRDRSFGSFRTFVHEIGCAPAMMRALNGDLNFNWAPNQNYARELLELFTMGTHDEVGAPNYTEHDVVEASRALTGWKLRDELIVYHDGWTFDKDAKTLFGRTGPWGYDDVVRLIFEERTRSVARLVARKLLAFYVTHTPDARAESDLADVLLAHDFALRPAYEALFASAYFFSADVRGSLVKGPIELYTGLLATLGVGPGGFDAYRLRERLKHHSGTGQVYFDAPDVAGWRGHNPPTATGRPGYLAWYESDSFGQMWDGVSGLVNASEVMPVPFDAAALVRSTPDPADPFAVARTLAERLIALPLGEASLPLIDAPFAGNAAVPLPAYLGAAPRHVSDLGKLLLGPIPPYEWARLPDDARAYRVRSYVTFLVTQVPEHFMF